MCISQECFNEARCLHHLIYRKMINSLTWDVRFSLISNNLLTFWLSGIFVAITPMYPGSPFDSSEQILRAYLRGCLWGLSLQRVHWVKYYSQLLDCAFFQSKEHTIEYKKLLAYLTIILPPHKCIRNLDFGFIWRKIDGHLLNIGES